MLRGAVIGRRLSFTPKRDGAQPHRADVPVVETLAMNDIDVHRWLQEWLKACAEWRAGAAGPGRVVALVDEPDPPARPDSAGMSQPIECRYYGRDFSAEEMALLRTLIAGPPAMSRFALQRSASVSAGTSPTSRT